MDFCLPTSCFLDHMESPPMYNDIEIFKPFYANGLIDMDGVNNDRIARIPFTKLLDIYDEVSASVSEFPDKRNMRGRVFCASNSLSGAPYECLAHDCRIARVDELSKFSALFADNVLYHNFIADSSPTFGHAPDEDDYDFRYKVVSDISVLYQLRDLISSGIVQPYTTPHGYCLDCFSNKYLGPKSSGNIKKASVSFKNLVTKKLEVFLTSDENGIYANCEGDETILVHGGGTYILDDTVKDIIPRDVMKKASTGGVYLSKRLKKEMQIAEAISSELITDAVIQKSVSKLTGGSILTHSPREIGAMKAIENDSSVQNINNILSDHWNIIIPYAEQISVDGLLKLREREGESFVQFRTALDNSVSEAFNSKNSFTEKDAREMYSDLIEPKLAPIRT